MATQLLYMLSYQVNIEQKISSVACGQEWVCMSKSKIKLDSTMIAPDYRVHAQPFCDLDDMF